MLSPETADRAADPAPAGRYVARVAAGLPGVLSSWEKRLAWLMFVPIPLLAPGLFLMSVQDDSWHGWLWGIWYLGFVPLVGPFFLLLITVPVLTLRWENSSIDHQLHQDDAVPVDWANPRWRQIAEVIRRSGTDPETIRAFGVFVPYANLRVALVARSPYGRRFSRMRFLGYWMSVKWKWLFGGAMVVALLSVIYPGPMEAVQHAIDSWPNSTYFVPVMVPFMCAVIPLGVWALRRHYVLNIRDAGVYLIISTQWRIAVRDPAQAVVFLHELAHVRHRDVVRRQLVSFYSGFMRFGALFAVVLPVTETGSDLPKVIAIGVFVIGFVCIGRIAKLVPLIQELRADAEACRDAAHWRDLHAWLAGRPATRHQRTRLAALAGDGVDGVLRRARRIAAVTLAGFALPTLLLPLVNLLG